MDREAGIVESTADLEPVGEWLDLAVRRDIRVEQAPAARDPETIRVLLVDDEPGLTATVARLIEDDNDDIDVRTATDPVAAVARLGTDTFDCIVSDYKMPGLSGLDFLKAVRGADPELPFIVFTAQWSERVASEAIDAGVTAYVRKGTVTASTSELVEHIRAVV